jgi:hypothetical protein
VSLPLGAALGPQDVGASYGGVAGQVSGSSASRAVPFNPWSALFGGLMTLRPDGSAVLTLDFFGIPLMFVYDAGGLLTGTFLGSLPLLL